MNVVSLSEEIKEIFNNFLNLFDTTLFKLGSSEVSIGSIIYFIVSLVLLFFISSQVKKLLENKILAHYKLDIGVSNAIGTFVKYIIIVIGLFIIVQSTGIDLSALGILAGALGVGIGLGLQNITNNFISGIIILIERPVKVGDTIEVGDTKGDVVRISSRATTIITNDNISVIVPNSHFISSNVINWSYNAKMVRFRFPIHVSFKEDPEVIKDILMETALENSGVIKKPEPDVLFDSYGDNALFFHLRVWTTEYINRPNVLKSQLYYSLFKKFKERNIEIPFPQRDIHLKSSNLFQSFMPPQGSDKAPSN